MLWCLGGAWWCLVAPATKSCGNGRVPDDACQTMLAGRCVAGDVQPVSSQAALSCSGIMTPRVKTMAAPELTINSRAVRLAL